MVLLRFWGTLEETINNMTLKLSRGGLHLPSPYALANNQRRFASILALAESYISSGTISGPPSTESALLGTPSPAAGAPTSILNTHKSYWKHLKQFIKQLQFSQRSNSFSLLFLINPSQLQMSFNIYGCLLLSFWKLDRHRYAKYYTSFEWHE